MTNNKTLGKSAVISRVKNGSSKEKQVELSSIHNFAAKLLQKDSLEKLKQYVRWQVQMREAENSGRSIEEISTIPEFAPISINLDITTSCNYACDHCVDMDILNTKIRYQHEKLMDSLQVMSEKGLKSVIVIGGGEPTVYPKFVETIRFMKSLGLQIAIVSNGSRNEKIAEIADCLNVKDWVRLSLDAGTDDTFQKMHKPRKPVDLETICAGIREIKKINPNVSIGFSYIITWKGTTINDTFIVENLHEMVLAAELARKHQFDFISYKPFLTRAENNNAEIVDLKESESNFDKVIDIIREYIQEAKKLETPTFRIFESTNLKVMMNKTAHTYMNQPKQCHMQFFRQVLSPLGMFNCPVYRNQPHGKIGENVAYSTNEDTKKTLQQTAKQIRLFNAKEQCKEVTCLYNHVNWWLEDLIENPKKLDSLELTAQEPDYFL